MNYLCVLPARGINKNALRMKYKKETLTDYITNSYTYERRRWDPMTVPPDYSSAALYRDRLRTQRHDNS
jgi:hypothetical protein